MTTRFAVVLGEALVDLIEGTDIDGTTVYRPRFGGSPMNVAVGVRRLGVDVEFVGALGEDLFGQRLREFLRSERVGVERSVGAGMGTCLAVAMSVDGHVRFEYFGDTASWLQITPLDASFADSATVIHAGCTVFNGEPAYSSMIDAFRRSGPFKTMDPNSRPFLIKDLASYRAGVEGAATLVDLVKLSGDDVAYLYPGMRVEDAARRLRGSGVATIIVTRAEADTFLLHGDQTALVPVPAINPVDATGAGDSFMAAVVSDVVRAGPPESFERWLSLIRRANAVASVACSTIGGAAAMPTPDQVQQRLRELGVRDE